MRDPKLQSALEDALLRRFVLVTGKGGVGKSTVTATLALMSARRGDRTLVCELNTHEQVSHLLGHAPVGPEVTELEENLWSVNIEPEHAMREYGLMKLRFQAFYRMVFENPLVSALVRFVPGINDLLMLGKAFNHEREEEHGQPVWDRIIIDAPATGHGLTFFRLPRIIRDAIPTGNMHSEGTEMWNLMTDPVRTAVHLVSLPEELPVQETRELHERLKTELGLPLGALFMNQTPTQPLSIDGAQRLQSWEEPPTDERLHPLWEAGRIRLQQVEQAAGYRKVLAQLGQPMIDLPRCYTAPFGRADIERLVTAIEEARQ